MLFKVHTQTIQYKTDIVTVCEPQPYVVNWSSRLSSAKLIGRNLTDDLRNVKPSLQSQSKHARFGEKLKGLFSLVKKSVFEKHAKQCICGCKYSYHSKDGQFAHLDLKYSVYRLTQSHNIYKVMKSLSPYPQFDSFVAQIKLADSRIAPVYGHGFQM